MIIKDATPETAIHDGKAHVQAIPLTNLVLAFHAKQISKEMVVNALKMYELSNLKDDAPVHYAMLKQACEELGYV